jgi:hypothetical protein
MPHSLTTSTLTAGPDLPNLEGLDARRRARFRRYARFVGLYLAEEEPAETFEAWERFQSARRFLRYRAAFYEDMLAAARVACGASGPPPPVIDGRADLATATDRTLAALEAARPDASGRAFLELLGDLLRGGCRVVNGPCTLDASLRRAVLTSYLERVLEPQLVPAFYDIDHLQDLPSILRSRYACQNPDDGPLRCARGLLAALAGIPLDLDEPDESALRAAIAGCVEPDLFDPLRYTNVEDEAFAFEHRVSDASLGVDACRDYGEYLKLNEEYSRGRRREVGDFDNREISLFRGNERDHRLVVRTIIDLIKREVLTSSDEVLVVGSRYRDEIIFFRQILGLERTVGVDLVADRGYIERGDMHELPFESDRFRLVYTAGTLSYSYNARLVIDELARVCTKPGYVIAIDAADRWSGPTPIARTDLRSAEATRRLFHRWDFETILFDEGRSMVPHFDERQGPECYRRYPSVGVRLLGPRVSINGGGADDERW